MILNVGDNASGSESNTDNTSYMATLILNENDEWEVENFEEESSSFDYDALTTNPISFLNAYGNPSSDDEEAFYVSVD